MSKHPIKLTILFIILGLILWLGLAMTGYPSALKSNREAPPAILFDNVRIVSMVPGAPDAEDNRAVLIVGDTIKEIGPAGSLQAPAGTLQFDASGKTLIPGLIDAHVHVWDEAELAGYLAHGVTGIRNLSGMPFHLPLKERIESGKILGPDFLTTGPILNSAGPNQSELQQIVETADDARQAVRAHYDAGYRILKVYSNLRREPYEAILDEAQSLGMAIAGHTPEGTRSAGIPNEQPFEIAFEDALPRGFQTIEHVESIVWHGLRDTLDEEAMRILAKKIAASGTVVTPTLIAHDNLVRVARSDGAYLDRPGVDTINPFLLFMDKGTRDFWSAQDPDRREAPRAEFYLKATRIMHEAGVPLILGTDAGIFTNIPGSSVTRELELYVEAGLTPHDALAAATRSGADALGWEKTGQIAPGYRANLVLLFDDPLKDVSAVEFPIGVMVRGYWLDEAGIEKLQDGARETSFLRSARRAIEMTLSQ